MATNVQSIFGLGGLLSRTNEIQFDNHATTPIKQNTEQQKENITKKEGFYCNTCMYHCETLELFHAHSKSPWHVFNVKLRMQSAHSITLDEFNEMGGLYWLHIHCNTIFMH